MSTDVIKTPVNSSKKKKRKKGFSLEKRRALAGYAFVSPFIIGFMVFMLYPLITSLQWAMSTGGITTINDVGRFQIQEFVWLGNFRNILVSNIEFLEAFLDTIQRTFLWTPFIIVFSLFIAILLNKKIKFRGVFRVIYFLPVLLGTGLVFSQLSPVTDMLTTPMELSRTIQFIFRNEGVEGFLGDLLKSIISMFWKTGVQIVIFLSGLQGISESMYEAARVDSANWWDMLWKITIPILSPMILLNTIYTIIDSFRDNANPIVAYISKQYANAEWTTVSAMGWLYFLVTLILLGTVFAITRRFVFYEK